MRSANEASRDDYDVVVVGSGMAGLTAGALPAKAGRKVLVVEAARRSGGCLQALQCGSYRFDSSVHLVGGCGRGEGGHVDRLLSVLGVRDECRFVRVDPVYTAVFPDMRFVAPAGFDGFLEAHVRAFPNQADGFGRLLKRCSTVARECLCLPGPLSYGKLLRRWWRKPWLLGDLRATVGV